MQDVEEEEEKRSFFGKLTVCFNKFRKCVTVANAPFRSHPVMAILTLVSASAFFRWDGPMGLSDEGLE